MIKLDELKTQVQVHESMQAEYPDLPDHFFEAGVSPKVLGILIETAEIAFGMQEPMSLSGNCLSCGMPYWQTHSEDCGWLRAQALKKELENE